MRRASMLAALAALAPLGCGGEAESSSTAAATPEEEVVAVARQYLGGIAAKDWAAVCDAHVEAAQHELAEQGGSCEEAVEAKFDHPDAQALSEAWAEAEPEGVVIEGDRAVVRYELYERLLATNEDGEWKLVEGPEG